MINIAINRNGIVHHYRDESEAFLYKLKYTEKMSENRKATFGSSDEQFFES